MNAASTSLFSVSNTTSILPSIPPTHFHHPSKTHQHNDHESFDTDSMLQHSQAYPSSASTLMQTISTSCQRRGSRAQTQLHLPPPLHQPIFNFKHQPIHVQAQAGRATPQNQRAGMKHSNVTNNNGHAAVSSTSTPTPPSHHLQSQSQLDITPPFPSTYFSHHSPDAFYYSQPYPPPLFHNAPPNAYPFYYDYQYPHHHHHHHHHHQPFHNPPASSTSFQTEHHHHHHHHNYHRRLPSDNDTDQENDNELQPQQMVKRHKESAIKVEQRSSVQVASQQQISPSHNNKSRSSFSSGVSVASTPSFRNHAAMSTPSPVASAAIDDIGRAGAAGGVGVVGGGSGSASTSCSVPSCSSSLSSPSSTSTSPHHSSSSSLPLHLTFFADPDASQSHSTQPVQQPPRLRLPSSFHNQQTPLSHSSTLHRVLSFNDANKQLHDGHTPNSNAVKYGNIAKQQINPLSVFPQDRLHDNDDDGEEDEPNVGADAASGGLEREDDYVECDNDDDTKPRHHTRAQKRRSPHESPSSSARHPHSQSYVPHSVELGEPIDSQSSSTRDVKRRRLQNNQHDRPDHSDNPSTHTHAYKAKKNSFSSSSPPSSPSPSSSPSLSACSSTNSSTTVSTRRRIRKHCCVKTVGDMVCLLRAYVEAREGAGSKNIACSQLGCSKGTIIVYTNLIDDAKQHGYTLQQLLKVKVKALKRLLGFSNSKKHDAHLALQGFSMASVGHRGVRDRSLLNQVHVDPVLADNHDSLTSYSTSSLTSSFSQNLTRRHIHSSDFEYRRILSLIEDVRPASKSPTLALSQSRKSQPKFVQHKKRKDAAHDDDEEEDDDDDDSNHQPDDDDDDEHEPQRDSDSDCFDDELPHLSHTSRPSMCSSSEASVVASAAAVAMNVVPRLSSFDSLPAATRPVSFVRPASPQSCPLLSPTHSSSSSRFSSSSYSSSSSPSPSPVLTLAARSHDVTSTAASHVPVEEAFGSTSNSGSSQLLLNNVVNGQPDPAYSASCTPSSKQAASSSSSSSSSSAQLPSSSLHQLLYASRLIC